MGVADITLSRAGQINAVGGSWDADNALFLKVFSGEVLTAFRRNCVFRDMVQKRSISSGRSAQFPVTGRFGARYHVPGEMIVGQGSMAQNEVVIRIDDILLADASLYSLDEAKAHFDIREIYSTELGQALAREYDRRVARTLVLGARQGTADLLANTPDALESPIDDPYRTGTVIDLAKDTPLPDDYVASLFAAAQALDEKDVPPEGRYAVCSPQVYYTLIQSSRAVNSDFNTTDNGSYAQGNIAKLAGFTIIPSNHVKQGSVTAGAGEQGQVFNGVLSTSTVDMTNTEMICFNSGAAGVVSLQDISMQMTGNDYSVMYQAVLMVAKYSCGFGFLRPEAAVEVQNTGTPAPPS